MGAEECPTSLVVTRIVSSKHEGDLRAWADRVADDAGQAEGCLAVLRFEQTGGLFHHVYRFRDASELARWEATPGYRTLMAEGDNFSTARRQRIDDRHPVVELPSEADSPKWKRFLMTCLGVVPIALTVNAALTSLPQPLPSLLQSALSSVVLVAAMTWVVMPIVSRRLKPWVVSDSQGEARIGG